MSRYYIGEVRPRFKIIDEESGREVDFKTQFAAAKRMKTSIKKLGKAVSKQKDVAKNLNSQIKKLKELKENKNIDKNVRKDISSMIKKYELIKTMSGRSEIVSSKLASEYSKFPGAEKVNNEYDTFVNDLYNLIIKGSTKEELYSFFQPLISDYINVIRGEKTDEPAMINMMKGNIALELFGMDEKEKATLLTESDPTTAIEKFISEMITGFPFITEKIDPSLFKVSKKLELLANLDEIHRIYGHKYDKYRKSKTISDYVGKLRNQIENGKVDGINMLYKPLFSLLKSVAVKEILEKSEVLLDKKQDKILRKGIPKKIGVTFYKAMIILNTLRHGYDELKDNILNKINLLIDYLDENYEEDTEKIFQYINSLLIDILAITVEDVARFAKFHYSPDIKFDFGDMDYRVEGDVRHLTRQPKGFEPITF